LFFYNLIILLYGLAIRLFALFNHKAKLWIAGRQHWATELKENFRQQKEVIWFHCASLGEFEQGRPVIEKFRKEKPEAFILLSFFSPSGYEVRKDYTEVNHVCYLPLDSHKNASLFIDIVRPSIAIFVKYEFWFNYINVLQNKGIVTYFISVNLRKNHYLFSRWGKPFLSKLRSVEHLFLQNQTTYSLLKSEGFNNISIAGDTRFDRVLELSKQKYSDEIISNFKADAKILIAGSTWIEDEKILSEVCEVILQENIKLIIAPHEVNTQHISQIQNTFSKFNVGLFSSINKEDAHKYSILVIDSIGKLMSIYNYANYAFVGGGFGKGIHNTLEPACFGLPIYFGPIHHKFIEAKDMLKLKTAFEISDAASLKNLILDHYRNTEIIKDITMKNKKYVLENAGATEKIWNKYITSIQ
jgi:3-deoxy-D-manno-octulosonic-acid transferase